MSLKKNGYAIDSPSYPAEQKGLLKYTRIFLFFLSQLYRDNHFEVLNEERRNLISAEIFPYFLQRFVRLNWVSKSTTF